MGAFNIGITTVITTDAAYVHESFTGISTTPTTTESLKIDPEQASIDPNATSEGNDRFGWSVAVGCGRIVVGVIGDHPSSGSTNFNRGSIYIFDLNGLFLRKVNKPSSGNDDYFGWSVSVGCGRIVAGSYNDDDSGASNAGSASIFDLDGNFIKILYPPNAVGADNFGYSVAVGCGRIVVGSRWREAGSATNPGSAFIYDLNGNLIKELPPYDPADFDYFGWAVAVGCGRIVIGSKNDDTASVNNVGSVYIYDLNGYLIKKLFHPSPAQSDNYGTAVAVGGNRIVVGAYADDDSGTNTGSAFIYDLNGNNEIKITASDISSAGEAWYGHSVAVRGSKIVIGAKFSAVGSTAYGAAYVYDLDGTNEVKLTASDAAADDNFAYSVAIGNGKIVCGAPFDDDNNDAASGTAYIFDHAYLIENSDQYWEDILETYKYSS